VKALACLSAAGVLAANAALWFALSLYGDHPFKPSCFWLGCANLGGFLSICVLLSIREVKG
jgi:hypothetical protein